MNHKWLYLAVVKDRNSESVLRQVNPLMTTHLELCHLPRVIPGCRTSNIAKLAVVVRDIVVDIDWPDNFEDFTILVPVHASLEFEN
jgi:hypothetical protein